MATYQYDDFRVTLGSRGHDGSYAVVAVDPAGVTQSGVFRVPFAEGELADAVLGLARETPRAGPTVMRDVGDDVTADEEKGGAEAAAIGAALAGALLAGPLGAQYDAAGRAARKQHRGLRLILSLGDAPELLSLPWELLYRRPSFLANQRRTPLVRHLATDSSAAPCIDQTARILGVIANAGGLARLDAAAERARMEEALAPMKALGRVELDWLEGATPRAMRQKLRDGNYHVLHYIGHGDFNAAGEGVLFLDDGVGGSVELDSTELANLVGDQRDLRLVVLNSCEGARTTLTDPFAGVATTLLSLDVPAVVAMQFPISDGAAILFAEELYTNLIGRQDPIDAAVAEGRKAIYFEMGGLEWATPVLFMADPRVELFQFELPAAPLPAPPDPITGEVPAIAPVTGRVRPNRRVVIAVAAAAAVVLAIVAAVVFWPSEDPPPVADWDGASFDLGSTAALGALDGHRTIAIDRLSLSENGSMRDADDFEEEPLAYWWTTSPFTNQATRLREFVLSPRVEVLALDHERDAAACGEANAPIKGAQLAPSPSDLEPAWLELDVSVLDDPGWEGVIASLTYSDDGLVERIRITHGCPT